MKKRNPPPSRSAATDFTRVAQRKAAEIRGNEPEDRTIFRTRGNKGGFFGNQ